MVLFTALVSGGLIKAKYVWGSLKTEVDTGGVSKLLQKGKLPEQNILVNSGYTTKSDATNQNYL